MDAPRPRSLAARALAHPVRAVSQALYEGSPKADLLGACLGHHAPYAKMLAIEYPLHFATFRGQGVVAALRIVYEDYKPLRMGAALIFNLMSKVASMRKESS